MPGNKILLRKLPDPKQVQLPISFLFFFFAKYQRVNRHAVPPTQEKIARICVEKIGLRGQRIKRVVVVVVVVIASAQLHLTKPELRFYAGLNLAHGMSEIRDGEDL